MKAGFLANHDIQPNRLELALRKLRAAGTPVIDLTASNPNLAGFRYPAQELPNISNSYFSSNKPYQPNSKGISTLREEISNYYRSRTPALHIPKEQIFVCASTSEAYTLLFSLLCDAGDSVLSPSVTYPLFEMLSEHQRVKLSPYPFSDGICWQPQFPSDTTARAALIVSPHNPTGCVMRTRSTELGRLALPIIADEVFSEIYATQPPPPLGALFPELPVFHLNGISKMLALPDLKIGWVALNDVAFDMFGDRLEILNDTLLSASIPMQEIAAHALRFREPFVTQQRVEINNRLTQSLELLKDSPFGEPNRPDGAYFLMIPLPSYADEEEWALELLNLGVLAHPGFFYGELSRKYLVISAMTEPDALHHGLLVLCRFLHGKATG